MRLIALNISLDDNDFLRFLDEMISLLQTFLALKMAQLQKFFKNPSKK